jgi:hypothetical protein
MVKRVWHKRGWRATAALVCALLAIGASASGQTTAPAQPQEDDFYRMVDIAVARAGTDSRNAQWKPAADPSRTPVLEVGGLLVMKNHRLAVATRMGDVWLIDGAYENPPEPRFSRFATALHEPLGLLQDGDDLLVMQRTELTRLRDRNADGQADEYLAAARGWGVSGNYHEYAFGPKRDGAGRLWMTLNLGIGNGANNDINWRGWAATIGKNGQIEPMCAGLRSPCALGANLAGDMFMADQQGNWVAANSVHHLRRGAFFGNAEMARSFEHPQSPVKLSGPVPRDLPYPQAVAQLPELCPPAVWIPYPSPGQGSTDIVADSTNGKFGPFAGQLFISDFTTASVNRVFLEKVNGQYQGAAFPFRKGFASAVVRIAFGEDGSLFAGLTNRGWSSRGTASHGLQRLVWTGKTPFEILEMSARPDGFELRFTQPVDARRAGDPASYTIASHTYLYTDKYGSPEIDARQLTIRSATVSPDGLRVRLVVDGLRTCYVHTLTADGVRSNDDQPLLHAAAYYTLNAIPRPQ